MMYLLIIFMISFIAGAIYHIKKTIHAWCKGFDEGERYGYIKRNGYTPIEDNCIPKIPAPPKSATGKSNPPNSVMSGLNNSAQSFGNPPIVDGSKNSHGKCDA